MTHIVQKKRPEELHHTGILHDFNVLRPRGTISHSLNE
jgi:hypothetical protein